MKTHWQTAALGMAAIFLAVSAAQAGKNGNQGGNHNGGGSQFRSSGGNNGGGMKFTPSFNPSSSNLARGSSNGPGFPKVGISGNNGMSPKIGGQTFKPQILHQNNGPKIGGPGIGLGNAVNGQPKFTPGRINPATKVADSIKTIGLNGNGPKLGNVGIKPADLGIKIGNKPLDPGFNKPGLSKPAKPIGLGVLANGNGNGNSQSSAKKNNGVGLGLGIGLGVVKNLMGNPHHNHHHNHCHNFCQPNYCWPSSCVTIDCHHYQPCPQPIYCLPPVQVIEVVTVIELPVVVAPPQPTVDPTALVATTDPNAALVAPVTADAQLPAAPLAPAGEAEPATRALTETPVSTTSAQPVEDANLVQVQVGSQVELKGKDLGVEAGQVIVQVGDLMLPATMKEWKPDAVKAELPRIGVVNPTKAFLHVVKPDGKFASSLPCLLIAPPQPTK